MSFDRSLARCSFCGRHSSEVRRMVAGPGAAYICDECLQLCNDILHDTAPFSAKALELASRPPVVIAAPRPPEQDQGKSSAIHEPERVVTLELEQKQQGMTLILHQMLYYRSHFELHYLWIRPPFTAGFAFVPRIIFLLKDNTGVQWTGDRGGMILARPELASNPNEAIYQGSARFRPLPSPEARSLVVRAADPLAQFETSMPQLWQFEITL
ncbi:MAG TPA: ClpX C4-type zinc finger protein [Ktedonobacteraceae bacterium]|nr:ClpX C4-type zinc finger protein [Ktedonobacteraceae bacterium]